MLYNFISVELIFNQPRKNKYTHLFMLPSIKANNKFGNSRVIKYILLLEISVGLCVYEYKHYRLLLKSVI